MSYVGNKQVYILLPGCGRGRGQFAVVSGVLIGACEGAMSRSGQARTRLGPGLGQVWAWVGQTRGYCAVRPGVFPGCTDL